MTNDRTYPPGISPIPWSRPLALRWQGRKAARVSWVGVYAAGDGKGALPVHSIKPQSIADSGRRMADAHLIHAAPDLFALLFAALPYLSEPLSGSAREVLSRALGTEGEIFGAQLPQFDDLV